MCDVLESLTDSKEHPKLCTYVYSDTLHTYVGYENGVQNLNRWECLPHPVSLGVCRVSESLMDPTTLPSAKKMKKKRSKIRAR